MIQVSGILVVVLAVLALPAQAETGYVTDHLRIGVRPVPDNNAPPTGVVVSGMKLEILKRSDDYVLVRNAEGIEGWLKDMHITRNVPVRLQLEQLAVEHQQTKKDAEEKTVQLANLQEAHQLLGEEAEGLREANKSLQADLDAMRGPKDSGWLWVALIVLVLLMGAGGFYAGVVWHRRYVMQKLGGLRF